MDSEVVLYLIIAARLLLPLLIPRYPLPGVFACVILDAADQSIMQTAGVTLSDYQAYDKALDVYFLSIAYISTMRNWDNMAAFQVSRALFYMRMGGVLAFELTGLRLLLVVLPNAFEAFFIYYEIMQLRGRVSRMTVRSLTLPLAVIWLVLKLPEEWWIHIAQQDTTDFIKTRILGASLETSFFRAIIEAPVVTGTLFVIAAVMTVTAWRIWSSRRTARRKTSPHGAAARLLAARLEAGGMTEERHRVRVAILRGNRASNMRPTVILEKFVLVTLVAVIFQQVLPGLGATDIWTVLYIAGIVVLADFLLRWGLRRIVVPLQSLVDIVMIAGVTFSIVIVPGLLFPFIPPSEGTASLFVFASLLTLFVTLYEHYRPIYDVSQLRANMTQPDTSGAE